MIIKPSKVKFISDELESEFNQLKNEDPIKKGIIKAIRDLQENAFCAIPIPKRLIPKEYIQKYQVDNLWKYDLPNAWRLIYTVSPDNEVQLISALLEWFDHKGYERRFSY